MKLQRREKTLAAVTGGILLLMLVYLLFFAFDNGSIEKLRADRARLTKEVETKQAAQAEAVQSAKRLAQWQRRALPSEQVAKSLYETWLRGLADRTGIRDLKIDSSEPSVKPGVYTRFAFTLSGHAALANLTDFLFQFYSAGHLHQIRSLSIKPANNDPSGNNLDVKVSVEALSLPRADRKDKLTEEPGRGLRLTNVAEYRDPIARRNFFAGYVPPVQAAQAPDSAAQTFVTAFIEVDGARQVWFQDRLTSNTIKVKEGDQFQIGNVQGRVRTVAPSREVTIELDGRVRRLKHGDNIRGGQEVNEPPK